MRVRAIWALESVVAEEGGETAGEWEMERLRECKEGREEMELNFESREEARGFPLPL